MIKLEVMKLSKVKASKKIGMYCKQYRIRCGVLMKDIMPEISYQTVSSYEKGNSSNVNMLSEYVKLAKRHNELEEFMMNIAELLINEDASIQQSISIK